MRGPIDHSIRDRVLDLVRKEPGIHLRMLSRRLEVHVNLIDYHIRILEKAGKIISVEKGGKKGFFPTDPEEGKIVLGPSERRILLILREVRALMIVLFLLVKGGARSGEVATEVNISPSTATHHLQRLVREGILSKESNIFIVNESQTVAKIIIDHRPGEEGIVDSFESLWEELSGSQ